MRGKHLRRRTALGIVACVCALVLAGGAGARLDTHTDPQGDAGGALDISQVKVDDNTTGDIQIEVDVYSGHSFGATDEVVVFLDSDDNLATGNGGAEYQLDVDGSGPASCKLYHWNGASWDDLHVPTSTCIGGTSLFRFPRSDIGNPPAFQYLAATYYGGPPPSTLGDRAPDSGWWLFDDTPPNTTITGGPSGSTTSTSASFSFTSTEPAGATFQCSLDGGPYTTCTSPHGYTGLVLGPHTFRVKATDSSGNTDASPDMRSWTVVAPPDTTAPSVSVTLASCCVDAKGHLEVDYTVSDDSHQAKATVSIRAGRKLVKSCPYGFGDAQSTQYISKDCLVPARARGWLTACVQAADVAGNTSAPVCKPVSFKQQAARPKYSLSSVSGVLTILSWKVPAGMKETLTCPGCTHFSARHPVGTRMPSGSSIEARVVKPRFLGTFTKLTNVHGGLKAKAECLPPGQLRPIISCHKHHQ